MLAASFVLLLAINLLQWTRSGRAWLPGVNAMSGGDIGFRDGFGRGSGADPPLAGA
jgi:hypothetical protein